jgi:HEAT repeat protein
VITLLIVAIRRLFLIAAVFLACYSAIALDGNSATEQNAERARSILKQGIEAKDPDTRVETILAASMIGRHERLLEPLQRSLQDKDVPVRIAAINALADLKLPGSELALEKTLKSDEAPEVSFAAAKALYVLKDPAGKTALMDVYSGTSKGDSSFLKKKGRGIARNFSSFGSATTFIVGQGMGFVPIPGVGEGYSAMTGLLNDPDLSPRATALLLLAKENTPASLDLLRKGLTDEDWSVRAAAAQMIATTAKTELRESLVPLFDDKKEKVRFRSAGAYLHLYLMKSK